MNEYLTTDEFLEEKLEGLNGEILENWIISKAMNILQVRIALEKGDAAEAVRLRSEGPRLPL